MLFTPISHGISFTTLQTLTICPVCPVTTATDSIQKPKRTRTSYTQTQIEEFEKVFIENQYPSRELMDKLSKTLDIPVGRMKTWFQNRRSRQKKARHNKIRYHHTYTVPVDRGPSPDWLGEATHGCGSERRVRQWSIAHTTTSTTNQACMNCDSQTVYSTQYHHPVMSPKVVRSLGDPLDEYFPRSSDQDSNFGNFVQQAYMRFAPPTAMGYTFHQCLNYPHSLQHDTVLSPQPSPGDYKIYSYTTDRKTCNVDNNTMFSASVNNNGVSRFSDNNFNPMYNVLLNVGQLQLSSYHMQVNTNARLCEQSYGGLDCDVNQQILASRYQSVDGDSTFANPQKYYPVESQHVMHTSCHTPHSRGSHGTPSNVLPWQFTSSKDFRLGNVNHYLLSSQSSLVDCLQNSADDSNRFRNENLGLKQHFRPGRETNLVQTPNNYVSHVARSIDDDAWSTKTSQDSDTESLESFESGPSIQQIDMTASLLSEFSLYGPQSPESFRGDTPHPELWSLD